MNILVTGGAGYVGSVLVPYLLGRGCRVTVVDSLKFGGHGLLGAIGDKAFDLIAADLIQGAEWEARLRDVEAVVHLAAIVGERACRQSPDETIAINRDCVGRLAGLCAAAGVSRFIFISTCSNYGKSLDTVDALESAPLMPLSLYAETKIAAEQAALVAASQRFVSTVLRFATVFGASPRMRFDLLVNELVRDAVCEKRVKIYGPEGWRPLLHIRDAAAAIWRTLTAPADAVRGEVFNIAGGNHQKRDLAQRIASAAGGAAVETVDAMEDPRDYRVSSRKANEMLGFRPEWQLDDGIQEIVGMLRSGVVADPYAPGFRNHIE